MDEDFDMDAFLEELPEPEPVTTVEEFERRKARLGEALEEGYMEFEVYKRVLQALVDELTAQWTRSYAVVHKDGIYAIHAVYLDAQTQIRYCSEEPTYPTGDTLEELRNAAHSYYLVTRHGAIEYTNLVPDYEPPSVERPF